jgi:uncharacterized protein YbjQ (UPF0145 family)
MQNKVVQNVQTVAERWEENMLKMPAWFQDIFGGTNLWDMILNNGLQVIGVGVIGWLVATWFERQHFKDMARREIPLEPILLNTFKKPPPCEPERTTMVVGSVVVAHDFFRTIVIAIRKLIGGNIAPYERLVQRGRREALIRMKEEAEFLGLDKVVNVRFSTSVVSGKFLRAVEMVAYGTGVKSRPVL